MDEITQILGRMQDGDSTAANELLSFLYEELRRIAVHKMAGERLGHTLQPTALVHEAWLRLVDADGRAKFKNRAHFFGAAAEAMRRILIDRARRKQSVRHGAGKEHIEIDEVEIPMPVDEQELLTVNEALDRFTAVDAKKAELVKLRYFVGMTIEEAAEALEISEPTANRWWAYSRAWLYEELRTI